MYVAAYKREAINRMGSRVRVALQRCDPQLPKSLRLQAVQVLKEGIVRGLMGKTEIYPGLAKMAQWGQCSERQARRNLRTMENWGLVSPVACMKGGQNATRFWVEPEAMVNLMMLLGANPHPDLIAEIRDFRADIRADIYPGHQAGQMSAGIYITTGATKSLPNALRSPAHSDDLEGE